MSGNKYGLWAGTAMLALLAACGGDGGNDGAGQPAQGTDLKQLKAAQAEGDAQTAGNAAEAASPATGEAAQEAAAGQQGSAKTDLGVAENGIRGEKLAAILISNNTYRTYYDEPGMIPERTLLYTDPGLLLTGAPPQGQPVAAPKAPDVFAYQYMESGNGTGAISLGSQTFDIPGSYAEFVGGYEPLVSIMNIRIDEKDIARGNGSTSFLSGADETEGKVLLTLDREATVRTQPYHDVNPNERQVKLSSDKTYELKVGQVVPYETVLQRWADAEGNFTELFVQRGQSEEEVRVCTNTDIKTIRRLTCNLWTVRGNNDQGTYVVDDRSVHQKDAGLMYWRSLPRNTLMPKPVGSQMGQPAEGPMGAAGVSGDVLATMLTQQVGQDGVNTQKKTPVPLQAAEGPFPATQLLADAASAPVLRGFQRINDAEQVFVRNDNPKSYEYAIESDDNKTFHRLSLRLGFSHEVGTLNYTESAWNSFLDKQMYAGSLGFGTAAADIEQGAELLNFGFNARTQVWGTDAKNDGIQMLHPARPFSVHKGELFAYDTPLQRWTTTDGSVEMLVKKGANDNQAALCLKIDLPYVKRTECSSWQLPSADWKLGTPLTPLGLSITDDRSVYAEESGERYWLTPPDALKPAAGQDAAEQPAAGQPAATQEAGADQQQGAAQ